MMPMSVHGVPRPPKLQRRLRGVQREQLAHLVHETPACVQHRGAIRQLITPSTVLPLGSISMVLAERSLFGISDVHRVGERQQEAQK